MRQIIVILFFSILTSCKTEYREIIATYPDGKTKEEKIFKNKNDKSQYTIIEYYNNGQISFKGIVENNKFVNAKLNYYENGNIKQIDSILNPCELDFCCCDGKVSKYYSNGKLDQTFENRNGSENGYVILYGSDSSGKIWSVRSYKNDKKNGLTKTYYESGQFYKLESFRNDTLVEHIYYFKENGDSMKILFTWKGKEDFPSKKWLENGQVFYATYLDTSYNIVLYRWTDKTGKELKRKIVSRKINSEWITSNGNWITPN